MEKACLHGADLNNAFLMGAKLAEADLTDSNMEGAIWINGKYANKVLLKNV
jgi:uncharacterized protein YjbI with pentapeptide repeats